MQLLQNKLIVLSGGAGLLGESLALHLGKHGSRIVLLDKNEDRIKKVGFNLNEQGCMVKGFVADVTQENRISQIASDLQKGGKNPDILINIAGLNILKSDAETEEWKTMTEAILKGTRNCLKAFTPYMESGCIINIIPFPERSSGSGATLYNSIKSGILALTAAWAKESGNSGNRVVAIVPGFYHEIEANSSRQSYKSLKEKIPTGDLGTFKAIADCIQFVSSPHGSYISGSAIYLDGGYFS